MVLAGGIHASPGTCSSLILILLILNDGWEMFNPSVYLIEEGIIEYQEEFC